MAFSSRSGPSIVIYRVMNLSWRVHSSLLSVVVKNRSKKLLQMVSLAGLGFTQAEVVNSTMSILALANSKTVFKLKLRPQDQLIICARVSGF